MRAVVLAALLATGAHAQSDDGRVLLGNELYAFCLSDSEIQQSYCLGYINGYIEGQTFGVFASVAKDNSEKSTAELNEMSNELLSRCVPEEVTLLQLKDVALNYLRDQPEHRHHPARILVWQSLREAFPCD